MVVTSSVSLDVFGVSVVSGGLVTTVVDDAEFDEEEGEGVMVFDDATDDVVNVADDIAGEIIDDVTTVEACDVVDDVAANLMNADVYVVCNDSVDEVVCSLITPGFGHGFVSENLQG